MGIHPQDAKALIIVTLALRLEHGDADRVIAAKDDGYIGEIRYLCADQFKVPLLIVDGNIAQVRNADGPKPGTIFTERRQMCRPESKPFGGKRSAFAGAGGSIIWNSDHCEVGSLCVTWLVQVAPKSMSGCRIHSFFFRDIVSAIHLNKNEQW
jgi:hypothetical protein